MLPRAILSESRLCRVPRVSVLLTLLACLPSLAVAEDFGVAMRRSLPAGAEPMCAVVADMNLDGWADLVVANYSGASVSVFYGDGTGAFGDRVDWPAGPSP